MNLDEVLALLRRRCEEAGGQTAWAKVAEVSAVYVSDVLNKRREPGKSILDALGLEKAVTYRKKRPISMPHKPSRPAKRSVPE